MIDSPKMIPEPWQDENADSYWAQGHIDPALMVLACLVDTALNVDYAEAFHLVDLHDRDCYEGNELPDRPTQARHGAQRLIDSVEHVWMNPSVDDEEQYLPCDRDDPLAVPFTRIIL
jgi:hypothetical protein